MIREEDEAQLVGSKENWNTLQEYCEATDDGKPIDMDDDEGAAEWLDGLFNLMR